jgi:hypothetical protein
MVCPDEPNIGSAWLEIRARQASYKVLLHLFTFSGKRKGKERKGQKRLISVRKPFASGDSVRMDILVEKENQNKKINQVYRLVRYASRCCCRHGRDMTGGCTGNGCVAWYGG